MPEGVGIQDYGVSNLDPKLGEGNVEENIVIKEKVCYIIHFLCK